jgi:hypothetical protein
MRPCQGAGMLLFSKGWHLQPRFCEPCRHGNPDSRPSQKGGSRSGLWHKLCVCLAFGEKGTVPAAHPPPSVQSLFSLSRRPAFRPSRRPSALGRIQYLKLWAGGTPNSELRSDIRRTATCLCSSSPESRRWSWICPGGRSAVPWLPRRRAGSGPCAAPTRG